MYSLVNASMLCSDLARLPHGAAVAGALSRALRLTPADLPTLAAEFRDDASRGAAWDELEAACGRASRAAGVLAAVEAAEAGRRARRDDPGPPVGSTRPPAAGREGLVALLALVRAEILDWTWQQTGDLRFQTTPRAVSVVGDAVAACYVGTAISPATFTRLRQPWTSGLRRIDGRGPARVEPAPGERRIRRICARLSTASVHELTALDMAVDGTRRSEVGWASALHSAAWAIELTARVRVAAAAELTALRALPVAGDPGFPALAGVVSASCAVIQACVVADLLDTATYDVLTHPWRAVFGPVD